MDSAEHEEAHDASVEYVEGKYIEKPNEFPMKLPGLTTWQPS